MNLLERRLLGFRALDVGLDVFLVALILGVYLAKTLAGGERGQIATAERQIVQERQRIVLLEAEVAHLERPERLSALARGYAGLGPTPSNREITPQGLADALQSPQPPAVLSAVAPPAAPSALETETSVVAEDPPPAAAPPTSPPPAVAKSPEPKP
ncbi:MAG: cell division protein [Phenylobacterium sp.]